MKMKVYSGIVICAAAIAVLSICGCDSKTDNAKVLSDIDKLQGTWIGTEIGGGGGDWTFVITGDKIDVKGPDPQAYSGTLKLNPDTEPKQADFVIEKCAHEPYIGTTALSIYKIEGDKLVRTHRVCPKCGPGYFLADHYDRWSCGKCGYTVFKRKGKKPGPTTGGPRKRTAARRRTKSM